jgi:Mrp family chromosome partitioning ATPase
VSDHLDMPADGDTQQLACLTDERQALALSGAAGAQRSDYTDTQIVGLVQRLFVTVDTAPKVIVFSGVEHRSGCSWVCARIAEMLTANLHRSVCLVDATLRPQSAPGPLPHDAPGTWLDEEWLWTPIRGVGPAAERDLWMLSYGSATTGWQTPLSADRFQSRLSELRKSFDYVMIDAPPINAYADATLLGRMADGLVMVLEASRTRRETAIRAQATLESAGIRIVGAVLNRRAFPIPGWLYRRL